MLMLLAQIGPFNLVDQRRQAIAAIAGSLDATWDDTFLSKGGGFAIIVRLSSTIAFGCLIFFMSKIFLEK